jgi:hypothetical protein
LENHQRRNTANAKSGRQRGLIIRIHFREARTGAEPARGFLEMRRHHSAGSAPGSPEIHDDRQIAASYVLVEARSLEFDRMTLEQCRMALGTPRILVHALSRNPHDRIAVTADDVDWISHEGLASPIDAIDVGPDWSETRWVDVAGRLTRKIYIDGPMKFGAAHSDCGFGFSRTCLGLRRPAKAGPTTRRPADRSARDT